MQQEKLSREQLQENILGYSEPALQDAIERSGGQRRIVELIEEHSNRIITGPGKRYRILLTYLMARALGADHSDEELVKAAVPIELTHGWSLELDDIHDDDDERRGEKTLHRWLEEDIGLEKRDAESLATTEAVFMSATARDAIYELDFL
ncbi:MAG: polyprenyl synthetase family protein, partial [Candidatus Nanohaloarchaea archaeon]